MQKSELHLAALRLASKGVPVFPCLPGTKEPACKHGFHDATTEVGQIDGWWGENPDYNLAFCPSDAGLAVIDPDGVAGITAWGELQAQHEPSPETYRVSTPRGGEHLYFRGELPPSQSRLAPHVDTRGKGSYALLPPSRLDGHPNPYRALNATAPAPLPDWIRDHPSLKPRERVLASSEDLDLPGNVQRATKLLTDYVARGNVAIEGEMGDLKTYTVACEVVNLGLSPARAMELMWDLWNPACEPPWEQADLETKVSNAASYAQNEAGAWAVGSTQEVFGAALDKLSTEDAPARPNRFKLWTLEELAALPPPAFLIPEMIPEEGLSLFYGPPGSYKSFIVLQYAAELARQGKPVVYIGAEGGRGLQTRADAWKLANEVDGPLPLRIVRNMPWASDGQMIEEFLAAVKGWDQKPCLVVIDTAARMMVGLNENDARDVGMFIACLDAIKSALGCAVAAIHHTGKDAERGARGSMALIAAMDAAFEIKAEKSTKALAVWCRRQKDVAERETPWTYEGRSVAGSLVFQNISASEYKRLTTADDEITAKKIGAVLVRLGARGVERAVTTHVLALEMVEDGLSDEQKAEAVSRLSGLLSKRASGPLEAYAVGKGAGLKWFLP